ncbi:MAG: P-loop NTPase fold protein [Oligoflexia bacterium]|nr:P-loop NTPase fold protein [Oligoflexia bacterium]
MKTGNPDETKIKFSDFDKLNLKPFAKNLLKSIEKGTSSSVGEQGALTISLNAEFGNGKTTFLKMFKHFIEDEKNQDYNVIFINAWTADFYGDPIIAILSEFVYLIEENKEMQKNEIKEITNKIAGIIGKISSYKATCLTGSVLNQTLRKIIGIDLKEIKSDMNNTQDIKNHKQTTKVIENQNILKELNEIKSAISDLKDIIQKYTENKKLIIIVDELDRARPDYAVHFLEDIKHFFDIKDVIFLVGVNRQQIETTVQCLYGKELNFDGYYRKFFKQEIDLPDPYKEAQRLVDALIEKTKISFPNQGSNRDYKTSGIYRFCKTFNLTLREIEIFINVCHQILGNEKQAISSWTEMDCYSFFICLFLKDREEFKKILARDYTVDNFKEFVSQKGFEYENHQYESDKSKQKEKSELNNLLGHVACSFATQKHVEEDKEKIENYFKGFYIGSISKKGGIIAIGINGLTLEKGQPALNICKNINHFKSAFNE